MTVRYRDLMHSNEPVHDWPVGACRLSGTLIYRGSELCSVGREADGRAALGRRPRRRTPRAAAQPTARRRRRPRPIRSASRTSCRSPAPRLRTRRSGSRSCARWARGSWSARRAPRSRARAFAAEDVLKGRLPREFALEVIGGRIGDSVVESPVQAFEPAHRYVLFLGPDGPAGPTIFPQSVVEVGRDAGAVVAAIERDLR